MFTSAHRSLVQNDTKKSRVHLQAAVVLDESELSKLVHEKVHAQACRTHHLGERFPAIASARHPAALRLPVFLRP
jgi:hypothetical protein